MSTIFKQTPGRSSSVNLEINRLKSTLTRINLQKRLLFPELSLNELNHRAEHLADLVICERHLRALLDRLQKSKKLLASSARGKLKNYPGTA